VANFRLFVRLYSSTATARSSVDSTGGRQTGPEVLRRRVYGTSAESFEAGVVAPAQGCVAKALDIKKGEEKEGVTHGQI